MEKSYCRKINLLSPERNNNLLFERDSFSINIADAFFLDICNYENNYIQVPDKHNFYELNMITKGQCCFEIQNKKQISVSQGSFIIIPPNVKHKISFESTELSRTKIFFTFESKEENNTDLLKSAEAVLQKKYVFQYNEQMQTLLSLMIDICENMPAEYKTSIFLHTITFIMETLRVISKENVIKEDKTTNTINRAVEYISLNASATLGVSNVADYLGISTKQFTRIFNKHMGISPGKYIKNCRISRISDFLLFSDLSITDIVESMEYPDYASLVNAFKRAKGITPIQYKNKYCTTKFK